MPKSDALPGTLHLGVLVVPARMLRFRDTHHLLLVVDVLLRGSVSARGTRAIVGVLRSRGALRIVFSTASCAATIRSLVAVVVGRTLSGYYPTVLPQGLD